MPLNDGQFFARHRTLSLSPLLLFVAPRYKSTGKSLNENTFSPTTNIIIHHVVRPAGKQKHHQKWICFKTNMSNFSAFAFDFVV